MFVGKTEEHGLVIEIRLVQKTQAVHDLTKYPYKSPYAKMINLEFGLKLDFPINGIYALPITKLPIYYI